VEAIMTKVSDFPEGYDVPEFIKGCRATWHKNLKLPNNVGIPATKEINGIPYRLCAWTEIDDTKIIKKDLEIIKKLTEARHITCLKMHKKYQCVYIA
jgi:hypothetical protein